MNVSGFIPDIPRYFSAIAQWGACLMYIFIYHKSRKNWHWVLISLLSLISLLLFHFIAEKLPVHLWVMGMLGSAYVMYLIISRNTELNELLKIYYTGFAFISSEFTQSLEWQFHVYLESNSLVNSFLGGLVFAVVTYSLVYIIFIQYLRKYAHLDATLYVSRKNVINALATVLIAFLISNLSYVYRDTPFSGRGAQEIFYIRTLVDFGALTLLFTLREQYAQIQAKYDLKAIEDILHRQYEQYQISKESMDMINRKYHDLKHHLFLIQNENDPDKQQDYLLRLQEELTQYGLQHQTGNHVLDTILNAKAMICKRRDIHLTCVAEGKQLDFMDVMDICTIFGNAIDNAIESVMKVKDTEKRLIRVAVFKQKNFLMMRFENYYENQLKYEKGSLATTKKQKNYHGYGIKSLYYTAEKYDGTLTIHTEDHWFKLCVLLPLK